VVLLVLLYVLREAVVATMSLLLLITLALQPHQRPAVSHVVGLSTEPPIVRSVKLACVLEPSLQDVIPRRILHFKIITIASSAVLT
jgi:hypothetical protein